MITSLKTILAPTWQKIALTIILYYVIPFLSVLLVYLPAAAGSDTASPFSFITVFILAIINPSIALTPLIAMLFANREGQIDPVLVQTIFGLGNIIQIVYYYAIASIVFYFKSRNKKVEAKKQDQVDVGKTTAEQSTKLDKPIKNDFKAFLKPALIIVGILVVGYMGLAFWADSENKKYKEQNQKALHEFEQTGGIANWKTFTSERGSQFQVQYPGWWEVKSSSKRDFKITGLINYTFSNSADDTKNNSVEIEYCYEPWYCKSHMQQSLLYLDENNRTNTTVGGLPAIKGYQSITSKTDNTTVTIPRFILTEPYKDAYYQFRLNGDLKNLAIFEKMIESFKFVQ